MKIIFLLLLFFNLSCAKKDLKKENLSFPIYGNYCGPLYPPNSMKPLALDEVDNACKNHDRCYELNGYFNQNCDMQLEMDLMAIEPQSLDEDLAKKLILFYLNSLYEIKK